MGSRDEYRIYNAHAPVDVDEKLFRTVRLSEDLEQAARTLALLSKEQLHGHVLESLWKAESAERKVKRALHDLFSPEPDRWLVRRLAKAIEGLSESEIRGALARAQLELAFPPLLVGTTSLQVEPARSTSEKRQKAARTALKKSRPETSVSLHDLLGVRLIRPPLNLSKTYLGRELSACVEADGRVTCLGQTYESLSTAAGVARASVRGAPPGRKYPQTNGWAFWQFRDEDGQLRELGVLRERYLAQQVRQLDPFREQRKRPTARG